MKTTKYTFILALLLVSSTLIHCEEKKKEKKKELKPEEGEYYIPPDQYDDNGKKIVPKTKKKLKEEYKNCNLAMSQGQKACITKPECCYFESYDELYDEHTPKCVSLDAYVRYTIKNPVKYMKTVGVSNFHNRVSMNTFCEIIDYDPKIPKVRRCRCKLNQKFRFSGLLGVSFTALAAMVALINF
jgi:hypothetical protein